MQVIHAKVFTLHRDGQRSRMMYWLGAVDIQVSACISRHVACLIVVSNYGPTHSSLTLSRPTKVRIALDKQCLFRIVTATSAHYQDHQPDLKAWPCLTTSSDLTDSHFFKHSDILEPEINYYQRDSPIFGMLYKAIEEYQDQYLTSAKIHPSVNVLAPIARSPAIFEDFLKEKGLNDWKQSIRKKLDSRVLS